MQILILKKKKKKKKQLVIYLAIDYRVENVSKKRLEIWNQS